ncbi:hypothetical protein A3194_12240 [Candidatus Thiodiazotropha endoloripes]|nr:hypothetical protein A3194_12240 [Candidatus Thiodiazotropha endoloripes]
MDTLRISTQWRRENGYQGYGGVVVLFDGEVQGWCNQLRDPDHWRSGCIAIDELGQHWEAVGGNEQFGALDWRILVDTPDY